MIYNSYDDELDLLIAKVEGESNDEWAELVDELGQSCHPDTLRKSFAVGRYSGYKVAKYYRDKIDGGLYSGDELDRIQEKKYELLKERKKIQAINNEYNANARIEAKNELFDELIIDTIKNLKPIEVKDYKFNNPTTNTAVCFIGDAHYGKEFKLDGLFGEVINEYNPIIFKKRMWYLLSQLEADKNRFNYDKLLICDVGDCIDGILRMGSLQKLKTGVLDSVIEYAEFMSQWICEVYNRLNVKVEYSLRGGNHDMLRLLTEKKIFEDENLGKVIHKFIDNRIEIIKLRKEVEHKTIPQIEVTPYNNIIYHNLYGMNILSYHGDTKNLKSDIEFFENFYQIDIDIIVGGHLHSNQQETIGYGYMGDREIIRVPSIMGTDDYALGIRKCSRAGAKFMLFNKNGKDLEKTYFLN